MPYIKLVQLAMAVTLIGSFALVIFPSLIIARESKPVENRQNKLDRRQRSDRRGSDSSAQLTRMAV